MAFKSIDLKLKDCKYRVENPVYADPPVFKSEYDDIPFLNRLPPGKGFSFKMDPPYCDFKVATSMCRTGYQSVLKKVLFSKRRSYISPDYIFEGLMAYTKDTAPRLDCPIFDQVLHEARNQFTTSLTPLSLKEASDGIPQNTSPGLPYINMYPGLKKGQVLDIVFPDISKYWDDVKDRKPVVALPDCAAFARSHIGDADKNKVRPVWAYPLSIVCAEARFALPFIDALKEQKIGVNTAYGMEMMKGGMEWLDIQVKEAKYIDPGCKFLFTDYTAFDSSVPSWLIRECFKIVMDCFYKNLSPGDYQVFSKIVSYFINTPIRNSDGRRLRKLHGIPSGSMFTNIIGTMVNFIVSRYIIKKMCCSDTLFDLYFGDDACIAVRNSTLLNIKDLNAAANYYFGMTINIKKSYWTTSVNNIHFLGYYNFHGSPFKPTSELVCSLLYPQYWVDDWRYTLARTMGTLMAAGGNNKDIFLICQDLYVSATNRGVNFEDAHGLITKSSRMSRHAYNMGVDPYEMKPLMFMYYEYSMPKSDCTKLRLGIELV
uniref:Putative RNA-dependent RNA polymerase n=1 Tax=Galbut virus TaxID=1654579 RepID=A0A2Z4QKQ4_9VIRU|nr:putative RNA-dependent RNA polymerase [Galbut virus]